jgi:glyoxylase I family protein
MTVLGFEHVGTTTADLDRSIGFYCGLLGLRLVLRKQQGETSLAFIDAGGGMLEIAERPGAAPARDVPQGVAGLRHLTFAVDSVDETIAKLADAGVEIIEQPRNAHNTELIRRVAFCRDPDGIQVELIERQTGR